VIDFTYDLVLFYDLICVYPIGVVSDIVIFVLNKGR